MKKNAYFFVIPYLQGSSHQQIQTVCLESSISTDIPLCGLWMLF